MGRVRKPSVQLNRIRATYTHGRHKPVRWIIHCTQSSDVKGVGELAGVDGFWQRQNRGYGAHFVIDGDGNAMQCAPIDNVVWATYMHNTGSIQFELIGFAEWDRTRWLKRKAQLDKLAKFIAWSSKARNIPISRSTVRMHRDYPEGGHWDPGPGFGRGALGYVILRAKAYRTKGW